MKTMTTAELRQDTADLVRRMRADGTGPERRSPERPTQYAIQNTACGQWLATNRKWLDREHALRFHSMTAALAYATLDTGLALDMFTVEAI